MAARTAPPLYMGPALLLLLLSETKTFLLLLSLTFCSPLLRLHLPSNVVADSTIIIKLAARPGSHSATTQRNGVGALRQRRRRWRGGGGPPPVARGLPLLLSRWVVRVRAPAATTPAPKSVVAPFSSRLTQAPPPRPPPAGAAATHAAVGRETSLHEECNYLLSHDFRPAGATSSGGEAGRGECSW